MTHSSLTPPRPLSLSLAALATCGLLGAMATGCNAHPIKPVEVDISAIDETGLPLDVNKKVDVLLVIDNSGSMGDEQANLAANFGPVIQKLEDAGADYRIGITTTDIGGKDCTGTANGGELQLSSCLDRPETFVFGDNLDQYEVACASQCQYADADLEIRPTTIDGSSEAKARPWLESYIGVGNLPEEVDTLDAFQCLAPQGISGCGWESPLEAMARALENMNNPERPEYGFLRDDALLAVLVVTDEVDCSYNPAQQDALFLADTFWAEGANYATSAVCWNAGVACSGSSPYEDCWDVDRDASGAETVERDQMMLEPVARYVEMIENVAASKTSGREVLVSVIAGVPEGYADGDAELVYADSADAVFQNNFGIGAGCTAEVDGETQTAIPPVRLKTFAEAFAGESPNMYSVCSQDYTPALTDIVDELLIELPPACFPGCALDIDESADGLDYSCAVYQEADGDEVTLPECEIDGTIPDDADACWIAKTGADMDPECQVEGQNLEFELLRRPGVPVPSDVQVSAACEQSTRPTLDCPGA